MNIVITGASSGVGYETALYLAQQNGNKIIAVSRSREKLEKLKQEALEKKFPSPLSIIAGDISDETFVERAASEIKSIYGKINVLINNAGLLINKPFELLSQQDWKNVYATNVFGAVSMIRFLVPLFSAEEKNHIVNISSMGGFQGSVKFKGLSAYSTSKAALAGLTECLAEELKDRSIAVNCLCLGSVDTEMFAAAFPSFKAASDVKEMGAYIGRFALEGQKFFNGKILPVSASTP